jgi:hypothetical protein
MIKNEAKKFSGFVRARAKEYQEKKKKTTEDSRVFSEELADLYRAFVRDFLFRKAEQTMSLGFRE